MWCCLHCSRPRWEGFVKVPNLVHGRIKFKNRSKQFQHLTSRTHCSIICKNSQACIFFKMLNSLCTISRVFSAIMNLTGGLLHISAVVYVWAVFPGRDMNADCRAPQPPSSQFSLISILCMATEVFFLRTSDQVKGPQCFLPT